ncbi:hypothetical protein D3C81_2018090 [compost metagenome]
MRQHADVDIMAAEAGYDPAFTNGENIDAHSETAFVRTRLGINPALLKRPVSEIA